MRRTIRFSLRGGEDEARHNSSLLRQPKRRSFGLWIIGAASILLVSLVAVVTTGAFAQFVKDTPATASTPAKKTPAPKRTDAAESVVAPTAAASPLVGSEPEVTTASFGDWIERCTVLRSGADSLRLCEVSQTIQVEGQSSPIAQVAVGRLKKSDPLRLTLVLPVNVAFPSTPKISIEGKDAASVSASWTKCVGGGCFAAASLSDEAISAWRNAQGSGQIESTNSLNQSFKLAMSFRGFSQALDALNREP